MWGGAAGQAQRGEQRRGSDCHAGQRPCRRRQPAEGGGNAQRGPRDERDDQQRRRPHRLVPERERDIVITTRPQLLPVRVRNKLTAAAPPPWPAARAKIGSASSRESVGRSV